MRVGRPFRLALVGRPGSGKTTSLESVAGRLARRGVTVGGVLQPRILEDDHTTGYRLTVIGSPGAPSLLARRRATGRGFDFDPDAFATAAHGIQRAVRSSAIVIVDELGTLEANGEGHLPALTAPGPTSAAVWLLAVREDAEQDIANRIGGFDAVRRPPFDPDQLVRDVLTQLGQNDSPDPAQP